MTTLLHHAPFVARVLLAATAVPNAHIAMPARWIMTWTQLLHVSRVRAGDSLLAGLVTPAQFARIAGVDLQI